MSGESALLLLAGLGGDPLAGLQRPPGSPESVRTVAWECAARAEQYAAAAAADSSGADAAIAVWTGQAATAFAGYAVQLSSATTAAGDAYRDAASALTAYGTALQDAQAAYDRAAALAADAVSEEHAAARAAQERADAPGTGPVPGPLFGPPVLTASPLRAQARRQALAAIELARTAGDGAAGKLSALTAPLRPPPPPEPARAPEHHWYSPVTDFAGGAWDSVKDPAVMVGGLVGLHGDVSDNWSALGGGLVHGATHPLDLGKALIDWEDLSSGHYARWSGNLAPGIAAALLTGGGSAALKGADAASAVSRTGKALDDVSDAGRLATEGEAALPGAASAVRDGFGDVIAPPVEGMPVWRVYGEAQDSLGGLRRGSLPGGQSWTPRDPLSSTDFRSQAGLPDENPGRFLIEGRLTDPLAVTEIRPALPLDGHPGGWPEFIIEGADHAVEVTRIQGVNEPWTTPVGGWTP